MKNLVDEIKLSKPQRKTLFFHDMKVIFQTLMAEVAIILMAMGIAYAFNFRVTIQPIVQIVSPLVK
jgi:uncharacterized membrane protein AbrB (regulator of aidB expression)